MKNSTRQAIRFLCMPVLEYLNEYVYYMDSYEPNMYMDDEGNTIDVSSDMTVSFYSCDGGMIEKNPDGSGFCYGVDGIDYGDIDKDGDGILMLSGGQVINISNHELDEEI